MRTKLVWTVVKNRASACSPRARFVSSLLFNIKNMKIQFSLLIFNFIYQIGHIKKWISDWHYFPSLAFLCEINLSLLIIYFLIFYYDFNISFWCQNIVIFSGFIFWLHFGFFEEWPNLLTLCSPFVVLRLFRLVIKNIKVSET